MSEETEVQEPKIDLIIKAGQKRLENAADLIICISGWPGTGKTTLAIELAKRVDKNFSIMKNLIPFPTMEKIREKMKEAGSDVLVMDEAMGIGFSQDWANQMSKELVKFFHMEARKHRKIVIMCIQDFARLNSGLRDSRIDFWFFIMKRGHVAVFQPQKLAHVTDPWGFKMMEKQVNKLGRRIDLVSATPQEQIDYVYGKLPNYTFYFKFGDITDEEKKEYQLALDAAKEDAIKAQQNTALSEQRNVTRMRLGLAIAILYEDYLLTQEQIGEKLKINTETVNGYLRLVRRRKVDKKMAAIVTQALNVKC